jgi:undecaprenyl pyrophosphate phosphatase UppP
MGRGLTRQDAVRFSFLLSAPVILAAGALKAKDLTGPLSTGIHGPILVGSLISGIGAYLSICLCLGRVSRVPLTAEIAGHPGGGRGWRAGSPVMPRFPGAAGRLFP